jgi:SAM-dependent methyltransferase
MIPDFTSVTELAGDEVSIEQVERLAHRYYWAGRYCQGQDVLEVACGAGQGLGYLISLSKSVRAGDITPALVANARSHYGNRVEILEMDAQALPFPDHSLNVVILFEAIYYLKSAERFVEECRRVLEPGGRVLIATANKDLYDFNPSPFSHRSYGVVELADLFHGNGFSCEFFGHLPINSTSLRQRVFRPVKMLVVKLDLMPKTMAGKKVLKRIIFGKLVHMPKEITPGMAPYSEPVPLASDIPDSLHKVIYCVAKIFDR